MPFPLPSAGSVPHRGMETAATSISMPPMIAIFFMFMPPFLVCVFFYLFGNDRAKKHSAKPTYLNYYVYLKGPSIKLLFPCQRNKKSGYYISICRGHLCIKYPSYANLYESPETGSEQCIGYGRMCGMHGHMPWASCNGVQNLFYDGSSG